MLKQDFLGLKGIGRVGRIDHDGVAADVGKILDGFLDVEFIGAGIATAHDHDIDLGDVDHRHGVVDRGLHDIGATIGKRLALRLGALGELQVDVEPALGKKTAIPARRRTAAPAQSETC